MHLVYRLSGRIRIVIVGICIGMHKLYNTAGALLFLMLDSEVPACFGIIFLALVSQVRTDAALGSVHVG